MRSDKRITRAHHSHSLGNIPAAEHPFHINSTDIQFVIKPVPQLHLTTNLKIDSIDVPGGSFDSVITRLQASYYFSPSLTTRVATQYSSLLEDFIFNFRLRWIYTPGSEMWLVYDEGRRFGFLGPSLNDRALIFKMVHNFHF